MSKQSYFLLRRLHSLLGVFPLGIFLVNHLITNSSAIVSAEFFEHKVALIHMLGPLLPLVEAALIFVPLSIHIALGVYIAMQGKPEVGASMPYGRNWAYAFQRWTGWIAVVYIAYHVIHLRFLHDMNAEPFSFELAEMFTSGHWGLPGVLWMLIYAVGGLAVVYHFANGLVTFCMSWGITIGPKSQRAATFVGAAVGAGLSILLLTSIFAFWRIGSSEEFKDEKAFIAKMQAIHQH